MTLVWNEFVNFTSLQVLDWAENQDWAQRMRNCFQDANWHAEGDVWRHTRLVFESLLQLDGFQRLTNEDQSVLMLAALWHDVAKPQTTQIDSLNGRIRAPRHAVKGSAMVRRLLAAMRCPVGLREQICSLVRYHSVPVHIFRQERPELRIAQLSWLSNNCFLFLLAMADQAGRITLDEERNGDDLKLFQELAKEYGCFGSQYPYANPLARFLAGRSELDNLHWVPHQDYRCEVTLLSGLPGSGKDTWLRRKAPSLPVVSLDQIRKKMKMLSGRTQGRVIQIAKEKCRELLRSQVDFAFNATNVTLQTRRQWINLFASYGARIKIVYLEPDLQILHERNRNRAESVPDSVLHKLLARLEPPHALEAHEVMMISES